MNSFWTKLFPQSPPSPFQPPQLPHRRIFFSILLSIHRALPLCRRFVDEDVSVQLQGQRRNLQLTRPLIPAKKERLSDHNIGSKFFPPVRLPLLIKQAQTLASFPSSTTHHESTTAFQSRAAGILILEHQNVERCLLFGFL